jgi:hypothetical protein
VAVASSGHVTAGATDETGDDEARSERCPYREEPVLTLAVVQSGVAMLVGFGLSWTGEQVGLVVGFSAAVLGWIARSQVTPNSRVIS